MSTANVETTTVYLPVVPIPVPNTLSPEPYNFLAIIVTCFFLLWLFRVCKLTVSTNEMAFAIRSGQVFRIDGLGFHIEAIQSLTKTHFDQLLRSKQHSPPVKLSKVLLPCTINEVSLTSFETKDESKDDTGDERPSMFLECRLSLLTNSIVTVYWGVNKSLVSNLLPNIQQSVTQVSASNFRKQRGQSSRYIQCTPVQNDSILLIRGAGMITESPPQIVEGGNTFVRFPLPCAAQEESNFIKRLISSDCIHAIISASPRNLESFSQPNLQDSTFANSQLFCLSLFTSQLKSSEEKEEYLQTRIEQKKQYVISDHGIFEAQDIYGTSSEDQMDEDCVVCLTEPKQILLVPCRHLSTCHSCFRQLDKCPVCRTEFTAYIRITEGKPQNCVDKDSV